MEAGWTTASCPATNLSVLIQYVNHLQGQSVISVALKTPLEIWLGICIYKTSLLHRTHDYIGLTPRCPSHILQQNCAHAYECYHRTEWCKDVRAATSWNFRRGQNDCNLLYLTTKKVNGAFKILLKSLGEGNWPVCPPPSCVPEICWAYFLLEKIEEQMEKKRETFQNAHCSTTWFSVPNIVKMP